MAFGPFGQSMLNPAEMSDQPVNESPDDILLRLFTQFAQEKAPTPPSTHLGPGQLFGLAVSGPLRNLVLQNMLNKQPGMQEYRQQSEQYEAHQKALGDIAGMMRGSQAGEREARLRSQFDQRMQMGRYTRVAIPGRAPDGSNVTHNLIYDNMTEKYYNQQGQEVDTSMLSMPLHTTPYPGPGGEMESIPTSMTPEQPLVPIPQSGVPIGASAGAPGIIGVPRPTEGGGQTAQPSNVLGPRMPRKGLAPHQAPAGVTQDVGRAMSFVQALAPVFQAWQEAKGGVSGVTGTGIAGTAGQLAVDRAAQTQGVRAFLPFAIGHGPAQAAINYKQKQKIALYNYVKQQTGAQFSVTEMDRYESMFPRIEDTEDTALNSLSNLAQKAVNDINAIKTQWHAIQTPSGTIYVKPDFMEEFLRTGGGMPQEQPQATDPAEAILQKYLAKKKGQR